MPGPLPIRDRAVIIRARQQYVDGVNVDDIIVQAGTSTGTLYKWLAGEVPGMQLAPIPRRRVGVRRLRPLKSMRMALVTRLWHTAEQQVREIEARLSGEGLEPTDRERHARALAVLVKTLRELAAMEIQDGARSAQRTAGDADDDDARDIDEFRRDLARQMDAIVARRAGGDPGGPDAA